MSTYPNSLKITDFRHQVSNLGFAAWFFIRHLERKNIFSVKLHRLIKMLLVISIPWYAFHSLMWPYSVAVSLLLISFVLFLECFSSNELKFKKLVLSGILFGLVLNFRSDYYLMPIGFAVIVILFNKVKLLNVKKTAFWLLSIYIMLIPWLIYTKHVTGHYLLTSTNSGHVFFIGLGNLPDNKWGITPSDGDPLMHELIEKRFGKEKSSLVYESDKFLKKKFIQFVREDPLEYMRKCFYSFKAMLSGGVYGGEFYEKRECYPDCLKKINSGNVRLRHRILKDPVGLLKDGRVLLTIISQITGRFLILMSFILLPFSALRALKDKKILFILLISAIVYQMAINIFAFHMLSYTSNMYFFHLINLAFGSRILWQYFFVKKRLMLE